MTRAGPENAYAGAAAGKNICRVARLRPMSISERKQASEAAGPAWNGIQREFRSRFSPQPRAVVQLRIPVTANRRRAPRIPRSSYQPVPFGESIRRKIIPSSGSRVESRVLRDATASNTRWSANAWLRASTRSTKSAQSDDE